MWILIAATIPLFLAVDNRLYVYAPRFAVVINEDMKDALQACG